MDLNEFVWTDVGDFGIEGKGWSDTERFYDRLPARAKGMVRDPLWDLSHHTAGLRVHFVTDSPLIGADWTLLRETFIQEKVSFIGANGLDLYVRHEGSWHWLSVATSDTPPVRNRKLLLREMIPGSHEYMLYLPLTNSVGSLSLGLTAGARLSRPAPQPGKPICFYGTSIVHGQCASRPGMTYPAILGRRLDRAHLNLGFAGSGRMEPEVAGLLSELDPCVYVLDCLPNLNGAEVTARIEPFVRILRKSRPHTPIVLAESIIYPDAPFIATSLRDYTARNAALRAAYRRLLDAGVKGVHYVPCDHLLGQDGEATVDGVHPTDLGYMRFADALEPFLKPLI